MLGLDIELGSLGVKYNKSRVNFEFDLEEIIIRDEARRGFYRLPTKSFAAWINAGQSASEKTG